MDEKLKKAFIDVEAYEMMMAYGVKNDFIFDFKENQDDFYITLIFRMMKCMEELDKASDESIAEKQKDSLVEVARGLIVYSEAHTRDGFSGVNIQNNHLFAAAIYYVCGYEAIASLLLRRFGIEDYETDSAKLLYYVISGCRIVKKEREQYLGIIEPFDNYMSYGYAELLDGIVGEYENIINKNDFYSVRDFTDSLILLYVLHRFRKNNLWEDLKHYDPSTDWADYINYSKGEHILSFLSSQRDALENGLLSFEHSFSLGMATSGGKSYITELLIYQELKRNPIAKVLYLAPLRSLSRELKMRFRKVGRILNIKCACKYGGNLLDVEDSSIEDAQLLVSTPETFITLEGVLDEELREFSLIICDEGQLLDDIGRGISYELLITRLMKQEHKRFLFLSAIIPNIEDINVWLGGEENQVGKSNYRPCELRYGVSSVIDNSIQLDIWDRGLNETSFTISEFADKKQCEGLLSTKTAVTCMTALNALRAGPVMIYTTTKTNNVGCVTVCSKLNRMVDCVPELSPRLLSKDENILNELCEYICFQLGIDYPLATYVKKGFAYHHGDLPQDIRDAIENAYANSALPLIVSTSTLAEGVNLPIKTMVIHSLVDPSSYRGNVSFLPLSSIKNIIGRVGRAGQQKYGLVIVQKTAKGNVERKVRDAIKSARIPPVRGTLYELVNAMSNNNLQEANYEQINTLLETEQLSDGIDLMITRNSDNNDFQSINVETICQSSLAYKLGSEIDRKMLIKVFEARYTRLKEIADNGDYITYLGTGLSIKKFDNINVTISVEDAMKFSNFDETNQDDFLLYLIPLLQKLELLNNDILSQMFYDVAKQFMTGASYADIAIKTNQSVDQVLELVNILQNQFADNVRAIISFVKTKFQVDNSQLNDWPDYLKYGIWTSFEFELVTHRLSDRVAVHGVSQYVKEIWKSNSADILLLKVASEEVLEYFHSNNYPNLTIAKVERWLLS